MFGSGKGILFRRDCQQKFMEIFLLLLLFPRPSRTNDFACKCISSVFWRKGVEDRWHAVAHGWTKPQKLKFFIWPIQKLRKCFVYFHGGYFEHRFTINVACLQGFCQLLHKDAPLWRLLANTMTTTLRQLCCSARRPRCEQIGRQQGGRTLSLKIMLNVNHQSWNRLTNWYKSGSI